MKKEFFLCVSLNNSEITFRECHFRFWWGTYNIQEYLVSVLTAFKFCMKSSFSLILVRFDCKPSIILLVFFQSLNDIDSSTPLYVTQYHALGGKLLCMIVAQSIIKSRVGHWVSSFSIIMLFIGGQLFMFFAIWKPFLTMVFTSPI